MTNYLSQIEETSKACELLLKNPHYQKMGRDGIFLIIQTAKSLGIDPMHALNGGIYYAKGKIEMSARTMNALIRARGHSIRQHPDSNEKICILVGKRKDTGDEWTESFSIEEAQKAGFVNKDNWRNHPKDMLFARALSRLARQLFPDVIGNCYIQGEIDVNNIEDASVESVGESEEHVEKTPETQHESSISEKELKVLLTGLESFPDYKTTLENFLEKQGIASWGMVPRETYDKIIVALNKKLEEKFGKTEEANATE